MTRLFPEHHSEPGSGPGREARGRTRERASGTNLRGAAGVWGGLFMGLGSTEEIWEGFTEEASELGLES